MRYILILFIFSFISTSEIFAETPTIYTTTKDQLQFLINTFEQIINYIVKMANQICGLSKFNFSFKFSHEFIFRPPIIKGGYCSTKNMWTKARIVLRTKSILNKYKNIIQKANTTDYVNCNSTEINETFQQLVGVYYDLKKNLERKNNNIEKVSNYTKNVERNEQKELLEKQQTFSKYDQFKGSKIDFNERKSLIEKQGFNSSTQKKTMSIEK